MTAPLVQIAIDTTSVLKARALIQAALECGADWIEIGKPLIEFEGLNGIRDLGRDLEGQYVLLDTMIMAAPEKYIRAAGELGASNVTVTALAPRETVEEAIRVGKNLGIDITVDLFNTVDPVGEAKRFAEMGADFLMVHFGVDQKRDRPDGSPIEILREVVAAVAVPVSYATYDLSESIQAVQAGASIIVQGEPLLTAENSGQLLAEFILNTKSARK